jgi:single-stranded-DNA-specific exonuclease
MNWNIAPKAPEEFIKKFPEYHPLILQLLYNRGLKTQTAIDEFFNPDYEGDLHDPFLMLGMEKAVKRIFKAIKKKEKIAIFGDYDADGVCGTVILKTVLEALGAKEIDVFIPNRMLEGYGLNNEAVKKAASQGTNLIITVDCGSTDFGETKLANSLGMEVIITDHHLVSQKLPSAKIIIDPFQKKDKYPFKELSGAGVVFKLTQALISKSRQKFVPGWEKWLLDLVAIATVADCMPLLGENRTLVRYGLIVLAQTQRIGLQELMRVARLSPSFEAETLKTNLDGYSLGFILAPRLNAAGRIHHASLAYELLMSENHVQASEMAQQIDDFNRQRQKITDEIVGQIEQRIKDKLKDKGQPIIIEADKDWSPGVVGLVAGRITDRYHRPAIIFNQKETTSRGSARSIPALNIVEAIASCADLLKEYGGHAASAGVSLENDKLSLFKERINQYAVSKLSAEDLVPSLTVDSEIQAGDISWEFFDKLINFEPFGQKNPAPTFLFKNLEIVNCRLVGNGLQHLKLELKSENPSAGGQGKVFKAIGFRLAKNGNQDLKIGDKIDIIFELILDEWNGNRELQFKIIDIKKL